MRKYIIILLTMILFVMLGVNYADSQMNLTKEKNKSIDKVDVIEYNKLESKLKPVDVENEKENNYIIMQVTAYDLSVQCCGKSYNHPSRGITRDGYDLNNKSHSEALTVSSNKFPMGTKLKLEFPESHKKYDGVYTVRDTGNFKENVLDVYVGDFGEKVHQDTIHFGRVNVKVYIINNN